VHILIRIINHDRQSVYSDCVFPKDLSRFLRVNNLQFLSMTTIISFPFHRSLQIDTLSVGSIECPTPISTPGATMFLSGGNIDRFAVTMKNVPFLRYNLSRRENPGTSSEPRILVSTWVDVDAGKACCFSGSRGRVILL
jgi:hypothetical protein